MRQIKIKGRGQRGATVPGGVIWGRVPGSRPGDLQPLTIRELKLFGIGGQNQATASLAQAGFQFFAGGLLAAGELLGAGSWSRDVTFTDTDDYHFTSLVPAAASAVFHIKAYVLGVLTVVATITFALGSTVGIVAWSGGSFTFPASTVLYLYAPVVADVALSDVTGREVGTGA